MRDAKRLQRREWDGDRLVSFRVGRVRGAAKSDNRGVGLGVDVFDEASDNFVRRGNFYLDVISNVHGFFLFPGIFFLKYYFK